MGDEPTTILQPFCLMERIRNSPCVQNGTQEITSTGTLSEAPEILLVLEILNRAFVFLRASLAIERTEIFSFARSRIFLPGIEPILAGFEFSDHC
jgi:hypothetical protein